MISHIVDVEVQTRLDRYLRRLSIKWTQGIIEKAVRYRHIKLNDKKTAASDRVISGDKLLIAKHLPCSEGTTQLKQHSTAAIALAKKILHEYLIFSNNELLAINKPYGLTTQGGSKISVSVQDALYYLNNHGYNLRLVHRLDKDTSGVLLIAKNYSAAYKLTAAFKQRVIQKIYNAIVINRPRQQTGIVQSYINKQLYKVVSSNNADGKLACTKYKLLSTSGDISFLQFMPLTGRTHQLRLHAQQLGCPIVGDKKYNNIIKFNHYQEMLLHAKQIIIPKTIFGGGSDITITAILPVSFQVFLTQIQKDNLPITDKIGV